MKNAVLIISIIILVLYILFDKLKLSRSDGGTIKKYPYRKKKYIFTQNEFNCYRNLKLIADKYGYEIFCKMRIADLVSVTESGKEYTRYFNKIKAKHIDFVLLDSQTMQARLLIELDDSSHDTEKRRERDEFVNKLCETVGLPLLRIRSYSIEQLEQEILNKIT